MMKERNEAMRKQGSGPTAIAVFFLSLCFLISSCKSPNAAAGDPVKVRVIDFVRREKCNPQKPCRISGSNLTNVSWNELHAFDLAVEDNVISEALGTAFSSTSRYHSRKIVFMKDKKIVYSEEHPVPEIDIPWKANDVDFDLSRYPKKYAVFGPEALFEIEIIKDITGKGEFYRLRCVNCQ